MHLITLINLLFISPWSSSNSAFLRHLLAAIMSPTVIIAMESFSLYLSSAIFFLFNLPSISSLYLFSQSLNSPPLLTNSISFFSLSIWASWNFQIQRSKNMCDSSRLMLVPFTRSSLRCRPRHRRPIRVHRLLRWLILFLFSAFDCSIPLIFVYLRCFLFDFGGCGSGGWDSRRKRRIRLALR